MNFLVLAWKKNIFASCVKTFCLRKTASSFSTGETQSRPRTFSTGICWSSTITTRILWIAASTGSVLSTSQFVENIAFRRFERFDVSTFQAFRRRFSMHGAQRLLSNISQCFYSLWFFLNLTFLSRPFFQWLRLIFLRRKTWENFCEHYFLDIVYFLFLVFIFKANKYKTQTRQGRHWILFEILSFCNKLAQQLCQFNFICLFI